MKKDYIGNYKIDKIPRIAQVIDDYVSEVEVEFVL